MTFDKYKLPEFALAGLLAVASWPTAATAAVLFADPAGVGNHSCNNLINAGTLSDCIAVAVAGDSIALLQGVHTASGLTIPTSLTLFGAGMGVTFVDAVLDRHLTIDPGAGGLVQIRDMTFRNGNALAIGPFEEGGSLLVTSGSLELVRTEITGSSADDGGAISCDGCTDLTLRSSRLANNSATSDGGAIYTDADTNLVIGTTISQNTADDSGGGIYKVRNALTLMDSEIVENVADGDGGGLYSSQDDTKVLRSAFIGNSALGNGGGVSVHGAQLTDELLVLNTTFSANVAASGGAVDVGVNNPAALGNVTMVDNLATVAGQADDIESSSALVSITLSNSILTHPAVGGVNPECGNAGVPVTLGGTGNLIDTNTSCLGAGAGFWLAALTPGGLGPLNFHGGTTRSYRLVNPGANNAIDNPLVGECLNPRSGAVMDQDQRLHPRPVGGGAACDIGSFEK